MIVKKYGNRRLYDTEASSYVTLDEVAERVRQGDDVQVVDAKTGQDLTQTTLAQIIMESRGAARLLPVPLMRQLIRMQDEALAEFFGRTLSWSLEFYQLARKGAQMFPLGPFSALPLMNPFTALLRGGAPPWSTPEESQAPAAAPPELVDAERDDQAAELAALRREIEDLKRAVHGKRRGE